MQNRSYPNAQMAAEPPWQLRGSTECENIQCARFDKHFEALWVVDNSSFVQSYVFGDNGVCSGGGNASEQAALSCQWHLHSRFRPAKGIIGVGFNGSRASPHAVFAAAHSVHVTTIGGCPVLQWHVDPQQQRKVQHFVAHGNDVIVTGETHGIVRATICPDSFRPTQQTFSLEAGATFEGAIGSAQHNMQVSALPKSVSEEGQKWIPMGLAGGTVAVVDASDRFQVIAAAPRTFQTRVNTIRCLGNTIAVTNSLANTSTVKVFDLRKMSEAVRVFTSLEGNIIDFDLFHHPETQTQELLTVTPHCFYALSTDEKVPPYQSTRADRSAMIVSSCVTHNGRSSVIATSMGLLTMAHSRGGPPPGQLFNFDAPSPSSTSATVAAPTAAGGAASTATRLFPPRHKAPKAMWDARGQAKDVKTTGLDRTKDPAKLFSAWPSPNYMILRVDEKRRPLPLSIRTILDCRESPEFLQLRQIGYTVFKNDLSVLRSDTFRPDQKDKLSRLIPNPYPFNSEVGTDPSRVAEKVIPLLKDLRAVRGTGNPRSQLATLDEALQVCYPLSGAFNWSLHNPFPNDIIGTDNTLPESWLSSILQCMFLIHGPQFPVRTALVRHHCKKKHCVACEVCILFTNMITAAATVPPENAIPIVQLGPLISAMKHRKEFIKEKIFVPAQTRDEMVGKLHLAHKLLLRCLDTDLSVLPEHKFPQLTDAVRYSQTIRDFFGTQLVVESSREPIDPILEWEVPTSAAKVDEGLGHMLRQVEFSRPNQRIHIESLPPVLIILVNPEHGHVQPPATLRFSRDQEEYSYSLGSQIYHFADDADDTGNFLSTHAWPRAASTDKSRFQASSQQSIVLVNDYHITREKSDKDFEATIPTSLTHSVVVAYYSQDRFEMKPYQFPEQTIAGVRSPLLPPPSLQCIDMRRILFNTYTFCGQLLVHDSIAETMEQAHAKMRQGGELVKSTDEIRPGDYVAIDAEYVVPAWGNQACEGSARFQRKLYMLLARVSCLVSSAPGDERLIMDDYLETDEEIEDYVSQYSGIYPGDLDLIESPYKLTTMKACVFKLRALADLGVRFVGHGLSQDFRVCNLNIHPSQIVDTLELFANVKAVGGRKLALRFLALRLLNEEVQTDEGGHDSIEDARTSLRLFRKYQELDRAGLLEDVMEAIMSGGRVQSRGTSPSTLPGEAHNAYLPSDEVAPARADLSESDVAASSTRGNTPATAQMPTPSMSAKGGSSAQATPALGVKATTPNALSAFAGLPPATATSTTAATAGSARPSAFGSAVGSHSNSRVPTPPPVAVGADQPSSTGNAAVVAPPRSAFAGFGGGAKNSNLTPPAAAGSASPTQSKDVMTAAPSMNTPAEEEKKPDGAFPDTPIRRDGK